MLLETMWIVAAISVGKLRTKTVLFICLFLHIIFELGFLMILVSKRNSQMTLESTINVYLGFNFEIQVLLCKFL